MPPVLSQVAAASLGFASLEPVASLLSIAHLFGNNKPRCGVYLLVFDTGLMYIGQAVEVVRRFSQHQRNHGDIVGFAFLALPSQELNSKEKSLIQQAERQGLPLTNAVHVSSIAGDTDLDMVLPVHAQKNWLDRATHSVKNERLAPIIQLPAAQQLRALKPFARFEKNPLKPAAVALLQHYLRQCIPAWRQTEYAFWSVSCMPATNRSTWPRLFAVNAGMMELMVVGWNIDNPAELWGFVTVAQDVLLQGWGSLNALSRAHPAAEFLQRDYRDAGQHQITLQVKGAEAFAQLLKEERVTQAAGVLALRVMRKRPNLYSRYHCVPLSELA